MVVGADDLDIVAHDVQDAAALQARRKRLIDEAHRNLDADEAVLADAQEVDVDRLILDRVDLQVARDDAALGPSTSTSNTVEVKWPLMTCFQSSL